MIMAERRSSIRSVSHAEAIAGLPRPFEDIEADREFIRSHMETLKQDYPDQLVVVFNGEVVAAGLDFHELQKTLKTSGIWGKAPVSEFIEVTPRVLIL